MFERWRSGAWICALSLLVADVVAVEQPRVSIVDTVNVGGALTHFDRSRDAFSRPAPGLSVTELRRFGLGNRVFNTRWVESPASVSGFDGLGPLFNRDSCSGCHQRDGRGRPPNNNGVDRKDTSVVRISAHSLTARRQINATFGEQLNVAAIDGTTAEAEVAVRYEEIVGHYADGNPYRLRRPRIELRDPLFAIDRRALLHLRVAPAVFGLGLIEAVPDTTLLAFADPDDADGDGISGRVNRVKSVTSEHQQIGRFGWKSRAASLLDQAADAAFQDIGLTSRFHSQQNCPRRQSACRAAYADTEAELSDRLLEALVVYLQTLAVPARSLEGGGESRTRGFQLFEQFQCARCHRPSMRTGNTHPIVLLRDQVIFPFSDFLLHDLGEGLRGLGEDGSASAREWRTPPLWGLGLGETVNGHSTLLHDGRARSIAEAILWHDGEAYAAREAFRNAPSGDREALVDFVSSL